jgi:hypothetical protein
MFHGQIIYPTNLEPYLRFARRFVGPALISSSQAARSNVSGSVSFGILKFLPPDFM